MPFYSADFPYESLLPLLEAFELRHPSNQDAQPPPGLPDNLQDMRTQWNKFYAKHSTKFFHPRGFLLEEFPVLHECDKILEVGVGNGSNLAALLSDTSCSELQACEVSDTALAALELVPAFMPALESGRLKPFLWDITTPLIGGVEPHSMDGCTAFFVLSACPPQSHRDAIRNLVSTLKVGASFCFRDYAQGDIAQLRAEDSGVLTSKSHVRPDLTLSYYFTCEEVSSLLSEAGLEVVECAYHTVENHNRKKGTSLKRAFVHALGRVAKKTWE